MHCTILLMAPHMPPQQDRLRSIYRSRSLLLQKNHHPSCWGGGKPALACPKHNPRRLCLSDTCGSVAVQLISLYQAIGTERASCKSGAKPSCMYCCCTESPSGCAQWPSCSQAIPGCELPGSPIREFSPLHIQSRQLYSGQVAWGVGIFTGQHAQARRQHRAVGI